MKKVLAISVLVVSAAALFGGALAAREVAGVELVPVAVPATDLLEPPIQEQLNEHRSALDAMLEQESVDPQQLGSLFGRMGQLYFVYDLPAAAEACLINAANLLPGDFRWQHYLGTLYSTEGEVEKAIERFEKSVGLEPRYVPSHVRLGRILVESSQEEAAEPSFLAALELEPENASAHQGMGRVYQSRKDWESAVREYEKALEIQPDATVVYHPLGMAYRNAGNMDKAREYLGSTAGQPSALRLADPIVEGLSGLIAGAQIHFQAGIEAARREDWKTAVEQFRVAISMNPTDHLAYYNLGLALMQARSVWSAPPSDEEIIGSFMKALEADPDHRDSHFVLGSVLGKAGRDAGAAYHYGEAHRIDPMDDESHLLWALSLSRLGRTQQALEEMEKLVINHPDNPRGLINVGTLLAQAGRVDEAIVQYERILALDEEVEEKVDAHLRLGDLLRDRDREQEAVEHYRAALATDPNLIDTHLALAGLLGRLGQFGESAQHFDRVVEIDANHVEAHFGRALALILGADYVQALEKLESSVETLPSNRSLEHLLARLLATCPDDSVRDGERAVELAFSVFESSQSLDHSETVAMALAEAGRFEEAVSWQNRVIQEMERSGQRQLSRMAAERLNLYRSGQAVRKPWG